jgi:hypothetical protein
MQSAVVSVSATPIKRLKSQPRNGRGEIFAREAGKNLQKKVSHLD